MSAHGREVAFGVSIPKPLSLVLVALVAIVVAFGVYTIATGVAGFLGPKRTSWKLDGAASGTQLRIAVSLGACDQFNRISVSENDDAVVIKAYIRQGDRSNCNASLNIESKTVQLSAPLGSRALRGCNPESSVYRFYESPDRDCAAETKINESPSMRELKDLLDKTVNASYDPSSGRYAASVGIGIRESDGQVYVQLEVRGVGATTLRGDIPNTIAGYEVRLLQPSPSP
jgi:hypothetical protein